MLWKKEEQKLIRELWKLGVVEEEERRGARKARYEEGQQVGTKNLSQNPPILGVKSWGEGKWGMMVTLFSFPIFFSLSFSLLISRGKCYPLPLFPPHFLSSPIFLSSKQANPPLRMMSTYLLSYPF